jgi:hypothetical protein
MSQPAHANPRQGNPFVLPAATTAAVGSAQRNDSATSVTQATSTPLSARNKPGASARANPFATLALEEQHSKLNPNGPPHAVPKDQHHLASQLLIDTSQQQAQDSARLRRDNPFSVVQSTSLTFSQTENSAEQLSVLASGGLEPPNLSPDSNQACLGTTQPQQSQQRQLQPIEQQLLSKQPQPSVSTDNVVRHQHQPPQQIQSRRTSATQPPTPQSPVKQPELFSPPTQSPPMTRNPNSSSNIPPNSRSLKSTEHTQMSTTSLPSLRSFQAENECSEGDLDDSTRNVPILMDELSHEMFHEGAIIDMREFGELQQRLHVLTGLLDTAHAELSHQDDANMKLAQELAKVKRRLKQAVDVPAPDNLINNYCADRNQVSHLRTTLINLYGRVYCVFTTCGFFRSPPQPFSLHYYTSLQDKAALLDNACCALDGGLIVKVNPLV